MRRWLERENQILREEYPSKGAKKIAKALNRSICGVHHKASKLGIRVKEEVLKNIMSQIEHSWSLQRPNLSPTNELAYCLGLLVGDGTIQFGYPYRIRLRMTQQTPVFRFKKILDKMGLNVSFYREDELYAAQIHSKVFVKWFENINLEHFLIRSDLAIPFIRGVYESEGTFNGRRIVIYNTNKELIHLVQHLLKSLYFKTYIYLDKREGRKTCYAITLGSKEEALRFLGLVQPCIKNHWGGGDA